MRYTQIQNFETHHFYKWDDSLNYISKDFFFCSNSTKSYGDSSKKSIIIREERSMQSREMWVNVMLHEMDRIWARSEGRVKSGVAEPGDSGKSKTWWGWASQCGLRWRDMGRFQIGQEEHEDKTIYNRDSKTCITFCVNSDQFSICQEPIYGLDDECAMII